MSLWTPDGEHRVEREHKRDLDDPDDDPLAGLPREDREQARGRAGERQEVREQLASVPASVVVANHAMGMYELAAIHLSSQPPSFSEAQVAIDAMAGIVEGLRGRLGEAEQTLDDALSQLKMAYVQLRGASEPSE